jgi:hypothetical protein
MDSLNQIKKTLERIVADTTADRQRMLDQREQELAAAMELLSVDTRTVSAYEQGQSDAYRRVQQLIQLQLQHLPRTSGARTVLHTLSRMVEERQ